MLGVSSVFAEEFYMQNDDKVTGVIINETSTHYTVLSEAFGKIAIEKNFVKTTATQMHEEEMAKQKADSDSKWTRKVSLGISNSTGNTEEGAFAGEISVQRKTERDDWQAKFGANFETENEKLDEREYDGLLRYAYNFGEEMKWYNFYKIEWSQDRFAGIDSRLVPAAGIGYWFSDTDDFKAMLEAAFGYEYTSLRSEEDQKQAVFVPRGFLEKKLLDNLTFREDVTVYPSLENLDDYRVESETSIITQLTEDLDLNVTFVVDHDETPADGEKKTDTKLITSVDYSF